MKPRLSALGSVSLVCALSVGCGSGAHVPTGGGGNSAAGASAGSGGAGSGGASGGGGMGGAAATAGTAGATAGAGGAAAGAAGTIAAGGAGGAGGATAGAAGAAAGAGGAAGTIAAGGAGGGGGATAGMAGGAAGGATAGMAGGAAGGATGGMAGGGAGGATAGAAGGAAGGSAGAGGASGAAGSADAGGAPPTCDVTKPFGTPVVLAGVNDAGTNNGEGRLSPDELTIYFYSDRAGRNNIYTATRGSINDSFGTPQPVTPVNTSNAQGFPSVTSDGQNLFLEQVNGTGKFGVYLATRTTVGAPFSAPALVPNINVTGSESSQPNVLPNESAIYFASTQGGPYHLYRAVLGSTGQFGTPAQISTIATSSSEGAPAPSADELVLYYGSSRPDAPSKGQMDIWMTTRASVSDDFAPPSNVQELNTASFEWPDWLSPDRCRLYFTRAAGAVTGPRSIYVATRSN